LIFKGTRKYTVDTQCDLLNEKSPIANELAPIRPIVDAMKTIFDTPRGLQALWHLPKMEKQQWHVDSIEQAEKFKVKDPIIPTSWKELIYSVFIAFSDYKIHLSDYIDYKNELLVGKTLVLVPKGSLLVITGHTAHAGNEADSTVYRKCSIGKHNMVLLNKILLKVLIYYVI
jgi:hypothetical protein